MLISFCKHYLSTASFPENLIWQTWCLLQVFVLLSSEVFFMDVFWSICNWSTLSDSFFYILLAYFSRILYHLWAPIRKWASDNSCTGECVLSDSRWLQSFCSLFYGELHEASVCWFHFFNCPAIFYAESLLEICISSWVELVMHNAFWCRGFCWLIILYRSIQSFTTYLKIYQHWGSSWTI